MAESIRAWTVVSVVHGLNPGGGADLRFVQKSVFSWFFALPCVWGMRCNRIFEPGKKSGLKDVESTKTPHFWQQKHQYLTFCLARP
jgi:hypothetical protein